MAGSPGAGPSVQLGLQGSCLSKVLPACCPGPGHVQEAKVTRWSCKAAAVFWRWLAARATEGKGNGLRLHGQFLSGMPWSLVRGKFWGQSDLSLLLPAS